MTTDRRPVRVLVADDNRDAADSLGLLLAVLGFEVRTAYDGDQAWSAAGLVWGVRAAPAAVPGDV